MARKYFAIFFARSAWHKNGTGGDKSLLFKARRAIRNAQVVGSIPSVGSSLRACNYWVASLFVWVEGVEVLRLLRQFWAGSGRKMAQKWHKTGG